MSRLLKKILWYPVNDKNNPVNITNSIDWNLARGLEIKNNVLVINLSNVAESFDSSGNKVYKYINDSGNIVFDEEDQFKVYLQYTDDFADIENSVWGDNTDSPNSTHLKGTYYLQDFDTTQDINKNMVKIKCADKMSVLFNRLHVFNYKASGNWTAPTIIQKIVRFSSESNDGVYFGTGNDAGTKYDVDAKLENSEGGYISDKRNDGSNFPQISLSKVWKPVYEWVSELSQIENINTTSELENNPIIDRPMIYWVDEDNKFHWVEATQTVDPSNIINTSTTTGIYNYKLTKAVFNTINFVVFRGGEDLYGNGTLDYAIDDTASSKSLKMKVIAMTDIAKELIQDEIKAGNLVVNTSGSFTFSGVLYNRNGNVTAVWNGTEYTSDSTYNTALRDEILRRGKNRAKALINKLIGQRYKGSIEQKGTIYQPGTLIELTNSSTGQSGIKIRIMDVRDSITKNGWFTTIQLEQDPKSIINST